MAVPPYEVMEGEKLRTRESFSVGKIAADMDGLATARAGRLYYSRENSITGANGGRKNGNRLKFQDYRFSVAPMMDWSDRHCRVFHRLMTRRARLYTEMLTAGAILHGDRRRLLAFDASEHPVALQLGGYKPADLALSAKIGEDFG